MHILRFPEVCILLGIMPPAAGHCSPLRGSWPGAGASSSLESLNPDAFSADVDRRVVNISLFSFSIGLMIVEFFDAQRHFRYHKKAQLRVPYLYALFYIIVNAGNVLEWARALK